APTAARSVHDRSYAAAESRPGSCVRRGMMTRIASLVALPSLAATSIAIAIPSPGRRHHDRPYERIHALTKACAAAMVGSANEQQCMTIVNRSRPPFPPAPMIQACERAMTGDANALSCLSTVVQSRRDPVPVIDACERAMTGDANALTCIAKMTRSNLPVAAVNACERAMTGDANA